MSGMHGVDLFSYQRGRVDENDSATNSNTLATEPSGRISTPFRNRLNSQERVGTNPSSSQRRFRVKNSLTQS